MKIFIDSANLEEIEKANSLGIIDGVTTNPTLIAKEGTKDFEGHIKRICEIVDGPISAEAVSEVSGQMIDEGVRLSSIHPNVVVKIPVTSEGLKAAKALAAKNIKVNMTLVFNTNQAILAAKAGAAFVSPFLGRIDDMGESGVEMLGEIVTVFKNYGFKAEIIAASIRHIDHIRKTALLGAHIATIPMESIEKMLKHPLTDLGIKRFLDDWQALQNS